MSSLKYILKKTFKNSFSGCVTFIRKLKKYYKQVCHKFHCRYNSTEIRDICQLKSFSKMLQKPYFWNIYCFFPFSIHAMFINQEGNKVFHIPQIQKILNHLKILHILKISKQAYCWFHILKSNANKVHNMIDNSLDNR